MPWLAQLVLRKKRRVELNDDIWLIVIAELSKISEPSLLALRLVNRNLAFLATPLAFRHITICTGAGKAPRMNEGLEYLVSEDGNRLRQYIREIDVTDSKFQRGQFKGWLIQELIEKLTCLEVFRWKKAMLVPLEFIKMIESRWPAAISHLEHTLLERRYHYELPDSGTLVGWRNLQSLTLKLENRTLPELRWLHVVRKFLALFESLRELKITVDEVEAEDYSPLWSVLGPTATTTQPVGQLRELVLDGMCIGSNDLPDLNPALCRINWSQLTRLEMAYPPAVLLEYLKDELSLVGLKVFRCGPLFGQWNASLPIERLWAPELEVFLGRHPGLQELTFTSCKPLPFWVLRDYQRHLKSLRLHVIENREHCEHCEHGCPAAHPYPVEYLRRIPALCPRLERLAIDIKPMGLFKQEEVGALLRFKRLRHLEVVIVKCRFEEFPPVDDLTHMAKVLFKELRRPRGHKATLESVVMRCGSWQAPPGYLVDESIGRLRELYIHVHLDERGQQQVYERGEQLRQQAAHEYQQVLRNQRLWQLQYEHEERRLADEERRRAREEERAAERAERQRQEENRAWKDGAIPYPPNHRKW